MLKTFIGLISRTTESGMNNLASQKRSFSIFQKTDTKP